MAKDLALAKSAYEEIMSNLHVGLNFYSDFGEFIQKFVVNCQEKGESLNVYWMTERRSRLSLELAYAKGLEQLSKRTLSVSSSQLGGFEGIWNKLIACSSEEAHLRHSFAVGISDEIIGPMTSYMETDADWRQLRSFEVELGKHLRAYEDEVKDVPTDISSAIDSSTKTFSDKALPMLQKFEEMDKSRKRALIAVLSRFCELFGNLSKPTIDVRSLVSSSEPLIHGQIPDRILAGILEYDVETDNDYFNQILIQTPKLAEKVGVTLFAEPEAMSPPRMVDEEGFTIVPEPKQEETRNNNLESSDEEDNNHLEPLKMKVEIASNVIKDDNSSGAIDTMKSLAAALPASRKKTVRQVTVTSASDAAVESQPITDNLPLPKAVYSPTNPFSSGFAFPTSSSVVASTLKLQGDIVETVNVLVREGEIEKLLLTGEIFVSVPHGSSELHGFRLLIHGTEIFENFVANDSCASIFTGPEGNGLEIDLSVVGQQALASRIPVAKYQVHVSPDEFEFYAPVLANPLWKCDQHSASLLFVYELNEDLIRRLIISDLKVLATLNDGGELASVKMKPEGLWIPENRSVLWEIGALGDLTSPSPTHGSTTSSIASQEPTKLIARFETSTFPSPGTVSIQFRAVGGLLSGIDIDVVNDERVMLTEVGKMTLSGTYSCLI
ncbi:hypothetical protein HDU84_001729 [Entophlyctis sp. JEL0112]|nr:hypothetical protein HDU84_001729 [Entophlyctis sp. JEL0112]